MFDYDDLVIATVDGDEDANLTLNFANNSVREFAAAKLGRREIDEEEIADICVQYNIYFESIAHYYRAIFQTLPFLKVGISMLCAPSCGAKLFFMYFLIIQYEKSLVKHHFIRIGAKSQNNIIIVIHNYPIIFPKT